MAVETYRKTALVTAEQFLPAIGQIPKGVHSNGNGDPRNRYDCEWVLNTKEGQHYVRGGDYICTGPAGEQWNVAAVIFEATYELAYAAPQPAHGTSATERVVDVDVRGIETSIDTMREAAWNLLVKQGWKPGSQLSGHSAVGLMAEFGMRVYRWEVGCDYPSCGCCADAACQDAVSQHPDLGGTLPASTPEVKAMEWTVFCSRSGNSQAETPLGQYVLQYEGLGFGALWMLYLPYKDTSTGKGYETIEAAKAAAQADYEQRILSALSTPTPKEESK